MIILNPLFEVISKYPDGTPKINKTSGVLSKVKTFFKLGPKQKPQSEVQKSLYHPIVPKNETETDSSLPHKQKHM